MLRHNSILLKELQHIGCQFKSAVTNFTLND